tara:strand:+ start:59449 stop:59556 length:108 start_codon:yes stop_codon:yes gene_type:complete
MDAILVDLSSTMYSILYATIEGFYSAYWCEFKEKA